MHSEAIATTQSPENEIRQYCKTHCRNLPHVKNRSVDPLLKRSIHLQAITTNSLAIGLLHTRTHRTYCAAVNTPMLILRNAKVWEAHSSSGAVARCAAARCRPIRPTVLQQTGCLQAASHHAAVQCIYHRQPWSYKKRVQHSELRRLNSSEPPRP